MTNCPTCRRRCDGSTNICPRCQTDLTELLALDAAGLALLAKIDLYLRAGDPTAAATVLDQARTLLGDTPELMRRQTICHLLARRFPEAVTHCFRRRAD